jgi:hypothetical protein
MIKFLKKFIQWIEYQDNRNLICKYSLGTTIQPKWHAMHYFPIKQKYNSVVLLMDIKIMLGSFVLLFFKVFLIYSEIF